ncbi:MAG: hypothetical protein PHN18_05300 [Sulfurospirillaceae bacterium]|nr:hypothetical protein [Sulfurospirillaceae bacterium]MDD2825725.1 hypothetical protein [Sulfurospirillaceae bacterium]
MKALHVSLLITSLVYAGDYDFDLSAIEVKPYTLSGYLKGENKLQSLNDDSPLFHTKNKDSMKTYASEGNLKFAYFEDAWKIDSEMMVNYNDIDGIYSDKYTVSQLFVQYKFDPNNLIEVGKKAPKWGKGYFVNPIAFFDRKKDPNDPEASREGFVMANYRYNKSYNGDIKNFSLDVIVMQNDNHLNHDYASEEANNVGLKAYFLYLDTDIDIIYQYKDTGHDKIGFDFAKNLLTNLEIHGEFANTLGMDDYAYLVGLKYLTEFELTITSEYFYQKNIQSKTEPFYDHQYLMHKLSQKEPLDILYSSLYYKNIYNLADHSMQNALGATYSFKNNMLLDISYTINEGRKTSEYGSKLVQNTLWSKLYWYF